MAKRNVVSVRQQAELSVDCHLIEDATTITAKEIIGKIMASDSWDNMCVLLDKAGALPPLPRDDPNEAHAIRRRNKEEAWEARSVIIDAAAERFARHLTESGAVARSLLHAVRAALTLGKYPAVDPAAN